MEFKCKVDKWWYGLILGANILAVILMVVLKSSLRWQLGLPVLITVNLFLDVQVFRNKVVVKKDIIDREYGIFTTHLPIEGITAIHVEKEFSLLSTSLENVAIYSKRFNGMRVGVENPKEFINLILKYNKKIKYFI